MLWNSPETCSKQSGDSWIAKLATHIKALGRFTATYRKIEADAPKASLYVVGYPNLFPLSPSATEQLKCSAATKGILPAGIAYLSSMESLLQTVEAHAASSAGAYFVDPNGSGANYFVNHSICDGDAWFNSLELPNKSYSFRT